MPVQPYAEHSETNWNGWAKIRSIQLGHDPVEDKIKSSATYTWEVNNTHPDGDKGLWRPEYSYQLEVFTDSTETQRLQTWLGTLPATPIDVRCRAGHTITQADVDIDNVISINPDVPNDDAQWWVLTVYIDVLPITDGFGGRAKTAEFKRKISLADAG